MGALCKAMEKQDDRLKIPDARLTSKTYSEQHCTFKRSGNMSKCGIKMCFCGFQQK